MNCPMAWEITTGKSSIFYCDLNEPEFFPATTAPSGFEPDMENFNTFNNNPSSQFYEGDAVLGLTNPLGMEHGLAVTSSAIAKNDNSYALVGTCPTCTGISSSNEDITNIDIDGLKNNTVKHVHSASSSIYLLNQYYNPSISLWSSTSDYQPDLTMKTNMDSGIVVISAASNGPGNGRDVKNSSGLFVPDVTFPGGSVFVDATDPKRDVKIISVAASQDGYFDPNGCGSGQNDYWDGTGEQFRTNFNFSPDTNKFNVSTILDTRLKNKTAAFVDLVAPGAAVLTVVDDDSTFYTIPTDITAAHNARDRRYNVNVFGTSISSPYVGGIVGLMRTVDENLGVTFTHDGNGNLTNGADIQRKAYDILTFTAKKITDFNNMSSSGNYTTKNEDGSDFHYDYIFQANDPLKRWWAQRVGFGEVNAYRAVAQSIPHSNELHSYTTSQSLDFSSGFHTGTNYVMHFGAFNSGGYNVLDHVNGGGGSIPTDAHAYNNQGETLINGTSATTLTVGSNDILAIDGIVKQTTATYNNKVVTSGTGKILATGMVQDVGLEGLMRVSDLVINSTTTNNYGYIAPTGTSDLSAMSQIYGKVLLYQYGKITLGSSNSLEVMPGGDIDVAGSVDFEIGTSTTSGVLVMRSASMLESSTSRKIIVDNGSTLQAGNDVTEDVTINGNIDVKSGGTLAVYGILRISNFTVESGGKLIVEPGARLILTSSSTSAYLCNGSFIAAGNSGAGELCYITAGQSCDYPLGSNITGNALLTIKGTWSGSTLTPAHYQSDYGNYTNVPVQLIDASKGPGAGSNPRTMGNNLYFINNTWSGGLYPILVSVSNTTTTDPDSVTKYVFSACKFSGPSVPPTGVLTSGLAVSSCNGNPDSLANCTFDSLANGVVADSISILNATFSLVSGPVSTYGYHFVTVCSSNLTYSTSNSVTCPGWGIFTYGSLEATDNTIQNYFESVGISNESYLRGNSIFNYAKGIETTDALLFLADHFDGAHWQALGRNTFDFPGGFTIPGSWSAGLLTDVSLKNSYFPYTLFSLHSDSRDLC